MKNIYMKLVEGSDISDTEDMEFEVADNDNITGM